MRPYTVVNVETYQSPITTPDIRCKSYMYHYLLSYLNLFDVFLEQKSVSLVWFAVLSIFPFVCSNLVNMCLFEGLNKLSNFDLRTELDLPNCEYLDAEDINKDGLALADTDLNILQHNIRGLLNKQNKQHCIKLLLNDHHIDVLLLYETWLNNHTEKLVKIPNYEITSKYRIDRIGGGVSILVDRKL